MKVFLIAYHFPPDPAVGSLRALKVARAFRDAGHEVNVITVRGEDVAREEAWREPGVIVHRVRQWRNFREFYAAWKARRQGPQIATSGGVVQEVQGWKAPESVPTWRRFLASLVWLPDDKQGFIPPVVRLVRSLGVTPSDLVYTTCPPYSPHLAGLVLKWTQRMRWIAEFRDPWTGNVQKPWRVRSKPADTIDAWLERLCLRNADRVVSVSEGIHNAFLGVVPESDRRRFSVVRNGIERLAPRAQDAMPLDMPRRIVHVGTFSYNRDPRPFLRALAAVVTRRKLGARDVRVDFVGQCRWFGDISLEQEVQTLGLAELVHFTDWVPHEKIAQLLDRATSLLLLAQDQPDQVPNKLYEYLGTRKPILAFADDDGESARMLAQVGGHHLIGAGDVHAAEAAIEDVIASTTVRGDARRVSNESVLREWTTELQMRHLLDLAST